MEMATYNKIVCRILVPLLMTALVMLAGCGTSGGSSSYDSSGGYSSGSSSSSYSSESMDINTYCSLYLDISNVKVSNDDYGYTYCTGTVTNNGTYSVRYVKVKASLKDYAGNIVDTDWTYAIDSSWLEPGESKNFKMMIKDEKKQIRSASLKLYSD